MRGYCTICEIQLIHCLFDACELIGFYCYQAKALSSIPCQQFARQSIIMSLKEITSTEEKGLSQPMDCLHLVSSQERWERPSDSLLSGRSIRDPNKPSISPFEEIEPIRHKAKATEKEEAGWQPQCRCKKSHCAKYYCDCFTAGVVCGPRCACSDCQNTKEHQQHSHSKRRTVQIGKSCFCTRSNCQKNYCACYSSGEGCKPSCKCLNCKNLVLPSNQQRQKLFLQSLGGNELIEKQEEAIDPPLEEKHSFPLEEKLFGDGQEKEKQIWDYLIDE